MCLTLLELHYGLTIYSYLSLIYQHVKYVKSYLYLSIDQNDGFPKSFVYQYLERESRIQLQSASTQSIQLSRLYMICATIVIFIFMFDSIHENEN